MKAAARGEGKVCSGGSPSRGGGSFTFFSLASRTPERSLPARRIAIVKILYPCLILNRRK
jgi:hypothetical protein